MFRIKHDHALYKNLPRDPLGLLDYVSYGSHLVDGSGRGGQG